MLNQIILKKIFRDYDNNKSLKYICKQHEVSISKVIAVLTLRNKLQFKGV